MEYCLVKVVWYEDVVSSVLVKDTGWSHVVGLPLWMELVEGAKRLRFWRMAWSWRPCLHCVSGW